MEIRGTGTNIPEDATLPIESLPKTALQAIYHAVTGKTESLSKELTGNVIVRMPDIDRLYGMLVDQLGIHEKVIDPTVTVLVKQENESTVTYSSWERFMELRVGSHEITSELTLKLEFVIHLPDTAHPQRCIVNVNIDSSLPVIHKQRQEIHRANGIGFFVFLSREWRTVHLSIDFVDFLVAKGFVGVVEEWFSSLEDTPSRKLNDILLDNFPTLNSTLSQSGRIGMAAFLATYVGFSASISISLTDLTFAVSIGLLIWAIFAIVQSSLRNTIHKRLTMNIVPSVILLTLGDERAYSDIEESRNSPTNTVLYYCGVVFVGLAINIISSYIYTRLTIT